MSVSVQLVSVSLAQAWALSLTRHLATAGHAVTPAQVNDALARALGFSDWADAFDRPIGGASDDTAPLTINAIKSWAKTMQRHVPGNIPLLAMQKAWAHALGCSDWRGVEARVADLNTLRQASAAAVASSPDDGEPEARVFYLRAFDINALDAPVRDRVWELGQRWLDGRHNGTRWARFWPRISQFERSVIAPLGASGAFRGLDRLALGARQADLLPLPRELEEPFLELTIAIERHFLGPRHLTEALALLQQHLPDDLRVPAPALPDIAELIGGDGRRRWAPFGWEQLHRGLKKAVLRHDPVSGLPKHPQVSLLWHWLFKVGHLLVEQRVEACRLGIPLMWPPQVTLEIREGRPVVDHPPLEDLEVRVSQAVDDEE